MMDAVAALKKAANDAGLTVRQCSPEHFQICGGALLVNYYPFSRTQTAYVAGTTQGKKRVAPKEAVAMAMKPPPFKPGIAERKKSYSRIKRQLWKKGFTVCPWCMLPMEYKEASVEHIIPLSRGGLDNANNRTLAHMKCNHERGHQMPEIKPHDK